MVVRPQRMRVRESDSREGPLTQTGKEWLGLRGARQLVASSVRDRQPLPVLWSDKVAQRERPGSGALARGPARDQLIALMEARGAAAPPSTWRRRERMSASRAGMIHCPQASRRLRLPGRSLPRGRARRREGHEPSRVVDLALEIYFSSRQPIFLLRCCE